LKKHNISKSQQALNKGGEEYGTKYDESGKATVMEAKKKNSHNTEGDKIGKQDTGSYCSFIDLFFRIGGLQL